MAKTTKKKKPMSVIFISTKYILKFGRLPKANIPLNAFDDILCPYPIAFYFLKKYTKSSNKNVLYFNKGLSPKKKQTICLSSGEAFGRTIPQTTFAKN
jgi:hypothetical protein